MRYALQVRVLSLREHHGFLSFDDHLERSADFDDILVVDIGTADSGPGIWATWNSLIPGAISRHEPEGTPLDDQDPNTGVWVADIPLAATAVPILGDGSRIRLTVTPWA